MWWPILVYANIQATDIAEVVENGEVLNDPSLELLVKAAVSQAKAGADIIAPSNMMDGFVAAIGRS